MKDAIITKLIPKIHKTILLFLLAFFLLGFFTFVALLEGFRIEHLRFGGIKIEKLYLKWENALLIQASEIDLSGLTDDEKPFTLKPLGDLPRLIRWGERWISSVNINIIKYHTYSASIAYRQYARGELILRHKNMSCRGYFTLDEQWFRFSLPSSPIRNGAVSGKLMVELPVQRLEADFALLLPNTPVLRAKASGDASGLRFSVHADSDLTTVVPIVRFLDVNANIAPWITEYADASSLRLNRLEGSFSYDAPRQLLETLRASATVEKGKYTFAQGFEPIMAPRIDLRFNNGKLYITPYEGTFYSLPLENSHLWIDFIPAHASLTVLIQTRHAKLNAPVLALLGYYGIDLPVKQMSGECAVDLNLSVDLHTLHTSAKGTFIPTPSELLLDRIALRSEGGIVRLDTRHVRIEGFTAHYGDDIAHARVNGDYNVTTQKGHINIDAYDVSPLGGNKSLTLFDPRTPLRVTYAIAPAGGTLDIAPSLWNIAKRQLRVDGFSAPFDYRNARVAVQSLPFRIGNEVRGKISALFDGAEEKSDINIDLERFRLGNISLNHAPLSLSIHYAENITSISGQSPSAWSVHKLPLLLSPFSVSLEQDRFTFERMEVVLGDMLKGRFSGDYRLGTQEGVLMLDTIQPISPKIASLIDPKESIQLSVTAHDDSFRMDAPALKAHFSTIPEGWKVSLDDISLFSPKSPLLRRYNIANGHINLFYTGENSRYTFDGAIDYPYPLMVINDRPQSQYRFSGSYRDGYSSMRVNDRLVISHTPEGIYARTNNAGINMPQLFKFLSTHHDTAVASAPSEPINVRIHGTNSYLYLRKGRKILADTLDATLSDEGFDATMRHVGGTAALKIRNGYFYIDGEGFNDTFMKHLFSLGDLSGGAFSFQARGNSDAFEGLMRVENTLLKDYKLLNNVLAFINTVPSLATFSLPSYHSKGLPVKEGYAHFAYAKGIVSVDNFLLNSPEMKILGEGRADIDAQTLNGSMTLKTDLGSVLGKVPMVGYILFGKDGSIATTLTLSGKLDDPKVETAIAKEIAIAPFNILKRTLIYPFLWLLDDEKQK